MLSFFQQDVLDEIWDVIESVSEEFLTYPCFIQVDDKRDHFHFGKIYIFVG